MINQDEANRNAGARIREVRQAAGLSQEAVSLSADMDQSTLSKLERLGPHVVSWQKLFGLASSLGPKISPIEIALFLMRTLLMETLARGSPRRRPSCTVVLADVGDCGPAPGRIHNVLPFNLIITAWENDVC